MTVAVRYFSRSGNTKAVAEALAESLGVEAVSVDAPGAALVEPVDVLLVGGALYAYGIDKNLRSWLDALDPALVGRAAVFSSAWLSRHAIDLIRERLVDKGIEVADEALFVRGKPGEQDLADARDFARRLG